LLDKSKDLKGKDALETGQAVLLGHAEIDYLVQRCADLARQHADEKALKGAITTFLKDEKKNIEALRHGSGLESALFGRMVTSDVLASRDAAVYVAHAFTVHEAQVENDYFTVVDDLLRESGEQGSAGIFDTELASGLYYGYVVIDVPQLVANLEGADRREWHTVPIEQRELAGRVVQHLLHLVATVSPGAKRGSTAPFEWAKFMLVEAGDWQPRSLAGAFLNALDLRQPALRQAAVRRLADELKQLDDAYGAPLARRYLAVDDGIDVPGARRLPLHALAEWAKVAVTQAQAQAEG
jgi:CRISPR system Cascade subunit CasC